MGLQSILGGILGGTGATGLGGISGNSTSTTTGSSQQSSYGAGGSVSQSVLNSIADSYADSMMESTARSIAENYSEQNGGSQTLGAEASARDLYYAQLANEQQKEFQNQEMTYNANQAKISREWQERMANTQYQRAIKDLISAGLNPILAVNNLGLSVPGGATASSSMASAYKGNSTADSSSWNKGFSKGYSESNSYTYEKSHAQSHSETNSASSGRSWEKYGSQGSSKTNTDSQSQTTNNMLKLINAAANAIKSGVDDKGKPKVGGGYGGGGGGSW